ncbi:2OG-Fe(II) oxygenase [Candidatus Nucleicultrix amoebiphila]|uniref:Prolyl 4-hydroxylase alpha subunit Fe(2+) 2OG dioxygenase domain-containing protein n=1 Tax=Candidatus Nucleicultrix amoebiphila FS5 TaxID=1414854 RepID=A0A1W6N4I3_9PROT|nr:2OG-Fe(II) oxygenase [Candidatus Nucleicultrix amoebiphila]ARN84765.1 hypothetical protein GQ61_05045 [Candidatus Nucleicultrix amoebiphila FS5]
MNQETLNHAHHLQEHGYVCIESNHTPLSINEWQKLIDLTDYSALCYKAVVTGDSGDQHTLKGEAILREGEAEATHPKILSLAFSHKIQDFLKQITNLNSPAISRCQVHLMEQGSVIGWHVDSDYSKDYKYAVILCLSDDYTGGEFALKSKEVLKTIKPKKMSFLITDCYLPHAVNQVISGKRTTLVYFLKAAEL